MYNNRRCRNIWPYTVLNEHVTYPSYNICTRNEFQTPITGKTFELAFQFQLEHNNCKTWRYTVILELKNQSVNLYLDKLGNYTNNQSGIQNLWSERLNTYFNCLPCTKGQSSHWSSKCDHHTVLVRFVQ